jgi:hypothetical protein
MENSAEDHKEIEKELTPTQDEPSKERVEEPALVGDPN